MMTFLEVTVYAEHCRSGELRERESHMGKLLYKKIRDSILPFNFIQSYK